MKNQEFANGLRLIADFYEKHDDMKQFTCFIYAWSHEEFIKYFKILKTTGYVDKNMGANGEHADVKVSHTFDKVKLVISVDKGQVCERIVTYRCPDSLLEEAMNAEEAAAQ